MSLPFLIQAPIFQMALAVLTAVLMKSPMDFVGVLHEPRTLLRWGEILAPLEALAMLLLT